MNEKLIPGVIIDTQISCITKLLRSYDIPLNQWGVGKAKTINHLVKEIFEGETFLVRGGGEIIRRIELVHIDVRCVNDDIELQLIEDSQEFKDGRTRKRGLVGISEKMKPGEDLISSAERALREELGVIVKDGFKHINSEKEIKISPSYPGLLTEYLCHQMSVNLPLSAFRSDGYIEKQSDK